MNNFENILPVGGQIKKGSLTVTARRRRGIGEE
jgi:hypothetical protein